MSRWIHGNTRTLCVCVCVSVCVFVCVCVCVWSGTEGHCCLEIECRPLPRVWYSLSWSSQAPLTCSRTCCYLWPCDFAVTYDCDLWLCYDLWCDLWLVTVTLLWLMMWLMTCDCGFAVTYDCDLWLCCDLWLWLVTCDCDFAVTYDCDLWLCYDLWYDLWLVTLLLLMTLTFLKPCTSTHRAPPHKPKHCDWGCRLQKGRRCCTENQEQQASSATPCLLPTRHGTNSGTCFGFASLLC